MKQELKDTNEKLRDFFEENGFSVYKVEQDGVLCAELERWTDRGVDMIIFLNPFSEEEFYSYVNNFDIDDEIDMHRQDLRYRKDFTISQSLSDFKQYHKTITKIAKKLKKTMKSI